MVSDKDSRGGDIHRTIRDGIASGFNREDSERFTDIRKIRDTNGVSGGGGLVSEGDEGDGSEDGEDRDNDDELDESETQKEFAIFFGEIHRGER